MKKNGMSLKKNRKSWNFLSELLHFPPSLNHMLLLCLSKVNKILLSGSIHQERQDHLWFLTAPLHRDEHSESHVHFLIFSHGLFELYITLNTPRYFYWDSLFKILFDFDLYVY